MERGITRCAGRWWTGRAGQRAGAGACRTSGFLDLDLLLLLRHLRWRATNLCGLAAMRGLNRHIAVRIAIAAAYHAAILQLDRQIFPGYEAASRLPWSHHTIP